MQMSFRLGGLGGIFCLYLLVEIEKGEEGLPVRVDVLGRIGLRGNVGLVNGVGRICSKLLRGVGRAFCTPNCRVLGKIYWINT